MEFAFNYTQSSLGRHRPLGILGSTRGMKLKLTLRYSLTKEFEWWWDCYETMCISHIKYQQKLKNDVINKLLLSNWKYQVDTTSASQDMARSLLFPVTLEFNPTWKIDLFNFEMIVTKICSLRQSFICGHHFISKSNLQENILFDLLYNFEF